MKQKLNNGFVFPTWEIHVKAFQPTLSMWACIDVYHILIYKHEMLNNV